MSKKRGFDQIGASTMLFPSTKRRKICNGHIGNAEKEQKEEEYGQLTLCMDLDNESITSVVESIDSLESDMQTNTNNDYTPQNEQQCNDLLCKLQFNPSFVVPSHHFTQTICILGGNYKILKSLLTDITHNLSQLINDYNFKLQLMNTVNIRNANNTNNCNVNKENTTKLISSMVTQQLLETKNFTKIHYENNINTLQRSSKYKNCDICLVFPDTNISILCQTIDFMKSPKKTNDIQHRLSIIEQNKRLLIGPCKKRLVLVNIGGFFNGLRLQIMNFSENDLPNPTNIVFVDTFNDAIKHLKQWSK